MNASVRIGRGLRPIGLPGQGVSMGITSTGGGGGGAVPPPINRMGDLANTMRMRDALAGMTDTQKGLMDKDLRTMEGMSISQPQATNAYFGPLQHAGWNTSGMEHGGRIGSAAGALGSKGMPTSFRGRFEKFGLDAAAMPTWQASRVARDNSLFGGGLRDLYNMNRPTASNVQGPLNRLATNSAQQQQEQPSAATIPMTPQVGQPLTTPLTNGMAPRPLMTGPLMMPGMNSSVLNPGNPVSLSSIYNQINQ